MKSVDAAQVPLRDGEITVYTRNCYDWTRDTDAIAGARRQIELDKSEGPPGGGPCIALPRGGSSAKPDPNCGGRAHENRHLRLMTMRHLTTSFLLLNG